MKDHELALRGAMVCLHQIHDFLPYFGPSADSLCRILEDCAAAGLNCLLVEYEAMFPYRGEHARIACRDTYTREEIGRFCARAKELGIQLIPLVQTLGHVYHILRHEEYAQLREAPEHIQQCCPSNPKTMELARALVDDMIDSHPDSEYIHLGGDECGLLGFGPVCAETAKHDPAGKYRLYVDYYRKLADYVVSRGRKPIIWYDIAAQKPALLGEFGDHVIFHFWNYGDHCHGVMEERFEVLKKEIPASRILGGAGVRGESGHGSLLLSPTLALDDIGRMNDLMLRERALGSIVTDWPDCGTPWPNSLSFFAAHGFSAKGGKLDRKWRESFAADYFGVDLPEWFDRLDAVYGPIPLADGLQTRLRSWLNRHEFAAFDFDKTMKRVLTCENSVPGYGNIFLYCHRRKLLREWIGRMEEVMPRVTRHKREFTSWLLTLRAAELLLTLSLGHIMRAWDEQGELCVGYQLTPSLRDRDLAQAGDAMSALVREMEAFYGKLSPAPQVRRCLKELFRPEYRVELPAAPRL